MLDGSAPGLSRWRHDDGTGVVRQYYWIEADRYVLVLEETKRPRLLILVTAFYVDHNWTFEDLTKKRNAGVPF